MDEEQGAEGGQSSYKLAAQPPGDFCGIWLRTPVRVG